MIDLVSILVTVAISAQSPSAGLRPAGAAPPFAVGVRPATDPVEHEYERLMALDDSVQEEMDRWITEADAQGSAADNKVLNQRIEERMAAVHRAYREFLGTHPDHVRARVAYGSFLNDRGETAGAVEEWNKALKLDPRDPAIYNNLAGIYGHDGPVTNAFAYYEKAIELAPGEPVYHENLATVIYLFRRDVMQHYGVSDEQQVFDMALGHYRKALALDPANFILATELAQTYYGIKPARHDDALAAWRRAYELASDDLEREGVRVHLARLQVQAGRFDEARTNLALVTNANFAVVKQRLVQTLAKKETATVEPAPPAAAAERKLE